MVYYLILIPLAVVMAVGLYYGLTSGGMLGESSSGRSPSSGTRRPTPTSSGVFPRVPQARELPQGCLLALILAATAWFIAWAVVLILALNLLRSPS